MANRYWIGGSGSWSGANTANWSATSGGVGGASVPTAADDVFFNLSSGGGTVTVNASRVAKSIDCTGYIGTLDISSSANLTLSGSATFSSGMTFTTTGISPAIIFIATATLTSAGKTLCGITVNGAGITVTLADALTVSSICTTTLTAGTLALANFTLSTGIFSSSGSSTRAITFGSGNIALTSTTAATTVLSMATVTNFSWTGTGGFTRNMAATATIVFGTTGGTSSNAPNLTVNGGSSLLTITATSWFKNLNFTGSSCSVSGGSPTANIAGDLTLSTTGTYTSFGPTFVASTTFTSLGKALSNCGVSGSGITVTLGDALTVNSTFTLTQGTLNLNNNTLSTGIFSSSNTNTRAISFGSGNIALTITVPASTILAMPTATNFTWTGTGGFTRNMAATATVTFGTTGGTVSNAPNLTVNGGASDLTITTNSYLKNVDLTGSTCLVNATYNAAGNLTLASGGTYTGVAPSFRASGTVTSAGKTIGNVTINAASNTVTLADAMTLGTTNTFTLSAGTINLAGFNLSTGSFSSNNSNTRAISFGSGNIALTSATANTAVLSMLNAIGFTWTGTGGFTRNMAATASMVFGTSGGTTSNAPNLTVNAGSSTLTFSDVSIFKNLDFTGSSCAVTALVALVNIKIAGNLTLASGGSYGLVAPTFLASGTITSSGQTINALTINGAAITVTLADALVSSGALVLSQGTLANPSNYNVTAFNFLSNSGSACSLSLGSSTWTITGGDATTSWVATNASLTFNAGTSTINLTYVGVKEFFAGNRTYYNVNVGGTGDFYIYGTNTFNNITNSVQPATVIFESGLTQTVSNFGLSGTAGNLITISSEAAGFQFTLSKASGTVDAQYLSIQDSVATGGAVWNAFTSNGNVDAGNNTGWVFSAAGGNMLLMFI